MQCITGSHGVDGNCREKTKKQSDEQAQLKHKIEVKSAFINYAKDMKASYDKIFGESKVNQCFSNIRAEQRGKMGQAIAKNQQFLEKIIASTMENNQEEEFMPEQHTICHNVSKIRTTVKQFFREWCEESPQLKDFVYLVEIAKRYLKKKNRVLVPGCGLARLALELVEAGFDTQGNEVTYFMLFGSNFILNLAEKKEQFQIYPFIHNLSNHESEEDMFRSVRVPDKLAVEVVPKDVDFSMAAGQFTEIYRNQLQSFDGVITCFFIDTANNIFQYIDTIYGIMKFDGVWINYGPLLYHYKDMLDQVSVQLSWQQVIAYINIKGFKLEQEEQRSTTYCHDPLSSYTHLYNASMTVWRKPKK